MKQWLIVPILFSLSGMALGDEALKSKISPLGKSNDDKIVLKNDTYVETGSQLYLEQGFINGEKAGVWVQVPATVPLFKVEYFRVLFGGASSTTNTNVFFSMGISNAPASSPSIEIQNAASITPGPYWNDIPAQGARWGGNSALRCVKGGEFVSGTIEFTQDGPPSVYRDLGPLQAKMNLLMGIPGGWKYSAEYGLQGNWVLRVVGHQATADDCK